MTDLRLLSDRPFPCHAPYLCPSCGQESIIGVLLVNERQEHMHTTYLCTFWKSKGSRCGWRGWSVPEANPDTPPDENGEQ